MHPSRPHSSSDTFARSNYSEHRDPSRSTVSWGAILIGMTAALALQVLFLMLVGGLGLAIYSPGTSDDPVANLNIGALIIHSICAIISLSLGGWVAGRFTPVRARSTGWLHGLSVWFTATVVGVILVSLGVSALLGGISKVVGGGLSTVGDSAGAVAGGTADLASYAVGQTGDTISSFVDEAVSALPDDMTEGETIRATREVGLSLARLFNPVQDGNTPANREAAVTALVEHTGMSQADANRMVTEWVATYEGLQDDLAAFKDSAAEKTREAAENAADGLATASLWSFFAFLLGALAATAGGWFGAKCATRCEETDQVGLSGHAGQPIHSDPDARK